MDTHLEDHHVPSFLSPQRRCACFSVQHVSAYEVSPPQNLDLADSIREKLWGPKHACTKTQTHTRTLFSKIKRKFFFIFHIYEQRLFSSRRVAARMPFLARLRTKCACLFVCLNSFLFSFFFFVSSSCAGGSRTTSSDAVSIPFVLSLSLSLTLSSAHPCMGVRA